MGSCSRTLLNLPTSHSHRWEPRVEPPPGRPVAAPRLGRMIRRIDLRGEHVPDYRAVVPRAEFDVEAALDVVRPICDAVRRRGVEAIAEYTARFDRVEQDDIAVPVAALHDALERLDPGVRAGLEESIRRLRLTCEAELEQDV